MGRRIVALLLGGAVLIAAIVLIGRPAFRSSPAAPNLATTQSSPVLTDIQSADDLKVRFNQDAGVPRLILLVSPT